MRKLGAGEELAFSQTMRRLDALSKKEKAKTITEEEQDEAMRLASNTMDMMASLFDDGEDGVKSKALVNSLSAEELKLVYDQIFEVKAEEPASAEAPATEESPKVNS